MILGVESERERCPSFDEERDNVDDEGKPDPFPCLARGATALTVCQSAVALATSFLISAVITSNDPLRYLAGIWGAVMLLGVLVFLISYKKEMFHLEDYLTQNGHTWLARHLGAGAGFVTLICSLILAVASALAEPSVQTVQTGM